VWLVAGGSLPGVFTASSRTEKQAIARAVEGGHAQDLIAVFSDALTSAHSSIIVLSGRQCG